MIYLTGKSEKALLLQVSNGSADAFTRLFHAYRDKLYNFLLTISGSQQMAEDVVHDVFLKIWEKQRELKHIQRFDSYLFRMAHNHLMNIIKRKLSETYILDEIAHQALDMDNELLAETLFEDRKNLLQTAINTLPKRQRVIFILSKEKGWKQQEIARQLNISIKTVKSHMTQALHSIREKCRVQGIENSSLFIIVYFLPAFLA